MKKNKKGFAVKAVAAVLAVTTVFTFSQMSAAESLAAEAQQEAVANIVAKANAAQIAGAIAAIDETEAAVQADSITPAPADTDTLASENAAYAALGQVTSADIAVSISDAAAAQQDSLTAEAKVAAAKKAYSDAKAKADDLTAKAIDAGKAATDAVTWYEQQHTDADGDGVADNAAEDVPEISEEMVASYCAASTAAASERDAAIADANSKLAELNQANAELEAMQQIASDKYEAAVSSSGAIAVTAMADVAGHSSEAVVTAAVAESTEEEPAVAEEASDESESAASEDAAVAENNSAASEETASEAKTEEKKSETTSTSEGKGLKSKSQKQLAAEALAGASDDDSASKESAAAETTVKTADTEETTAAAAVTYVSQSDAKAANDAAEADKELAALEAKYGMDSYDRDLLAALVFYEANTEPANGKVAVASVVLNRIESSAYPNTLQGVIYQRSQFTPARKCAAMADAKSAPKTCYDAVDAALAGERPVGNALHFMRKELHGGTIIQNHAFW